MTPSSNRGLSLSCLEFLQLLLLLHLSDHIRPACIIQASLHTLQSAVLITSAKSPIHRVWGLGQGLHWRECTVPLRASQRGANRKALSYETRSNQTLGNMTVCRFGLLRLSRGPLLLFCPPNSPFLGGNAPFSFSVVFMALPITGFYPLDHRDRA